MTREEVLKRKIDSSFASKKDFASKIGMPYSTLLSILKNVGGAALDNVFKICHGLNMSADDLNIFDSSNFFDTTGPEQRLLQKYRKLSPAGQDYVNDQIDFRLNKERSRLKSEEEIF